MIKITDFNFDIPQILLAHEYNYPPHYMYTNYSEGRKCHGIILALSGSAEYILSNKTMRINEGDIMYIPENTAYKVVNRSDNVQFHHYTVNFKLTVESGDINMTEFTLIKTRQYQMYNNLFEQISSAWFDKKAGYMTLCKSYLYNILFCFFTEYFNSSVNLDLLDRVLPAKNYIDTYYMRQIIVDELSEMCGLSQTNFRRMFKTAFGRSPIQYLLELRIAKAKDLLLCKQYHVREISDMVGYNDFNYFSRIFKVYTGVSPSEFKRMY